MVWGLVPCTSQFAGTPAKPTVWLPDGTSLSITAAATPTEP